VALAGLALVWRVRRFEVAGGSMLPTLQPGDRLLLVRTRRAGAGDLVVVPDPRRPGRLVVKRVAAVSPGGELTLAGDNPAASTDSRVFGDVRPADLRGRVVYRYHPPARRAWFHRVP
jgi:nickel-type superoxide dismutase maturation protease